MALDNLYTLSEIQSRVSELSPYIDYFKVGLGAFTTFGPRIIEIIQKEEGRIFLDMKFFDIPNTVKEASLKIAKLGVDILNVHSLGGREMMEAALEGAQQGANLAGCVTPKVIGVTILTSMNQYQLNTALGQDINLKTTVSHLSHEVKNSGLDGIVCSANDLPQIYNQHSRDFMTITPGISGIEGQVGSDQKRVSTPGQAVENGSHLLVIGRAISGYPTKEQRINETKKIIASIEKYI